MGDNPYASPAPDPSEAASSPEPIKRPLGVVLVSILVVVPALLILVGFLMMVASQGIERMHAMSHQRGVPLEIIGLVLLPGIVAAPAMWMRRQLGWCLAVLHCSLMLYPCFRGWLQHGQLITEQGIIALFHLPAIAYLLTSKPRAYFELPLWTAGWLTLGMAILAVLMHIVLFWAVLLRRI